MRGWGVVVSALLFYACTTSGFPRIPLLGFSVNKGQEEGRDDSLLALFSLQAVEGFHHLRRDIGVVVHYLPFPAFTPVDIRDPPIDAYRIASELRLAMFSAYCVRYIVC